MAYLGRLELLSRYLCPICVQSRIMFYSSKVWVLLYWEKLSTSENLHSQKKTWQKSDDLILAVESVRTLIFINVETVMG